MEDPRMNETVKNRCELLMYNWNQAKSAFSFENGMTTMTCANIFTSKDKRSDVDVLKQYKSMLKEKVGFFSDFRSYAMIPIIAIVATSDTPEQTLDYGMEIHGMLKEHFWSSSYLPVAAMMIATMAEPGKFSEIVEKTNAIYKKMKSEHPFLTSSEDSAFCALLAMSDKSIDELVYDMEKCYNVLKGKFFSSNAVQSLSHVLALGNGVPELKCEKAMKIFNSLKEKGYKYGTEYELPTLGVLAMIDEDTEELVAKIIDVDIWLAGQKGFGFFGSFTKRQRLMLAAMMVQRDYIQSDTMQTAAINGTIALLIAQQVAICAAAASAATVSASSNN